MTIPILTAKEKAYVAKLIASEVSYFNGWEVSQDQLREDCLKAAKKVERYFRRKAKQNDPYHPITPNLVDGSK